MPVASKVSILTELLHFGLNSVGVLVLQLGPPVLQVAVEEDLEEAVVVISCQTRAQLRVILS